mmetsp:Transcript_708/g.995  ORF Transcript_708/g.995 Transcript_708/m.995 type:complete len:100 (+) Transcript_708:245-544(+)
MSLLARRGQEEWTIGVEALRQELMRPLPLLRMRVQGPVENAHTIAFLDGELVRQSDILVKHNGCDAGWVLEPEALHHNHAQVLQICAIVDRHSLLELLS